MNRDRTTSDLGTGTSAAEETTLRRRPTYITSAPLADILHEQLDYLVAHTGHACAPGCADCARLQQVQGALLLPFRGHRRIRSRAA